MTLQQLKYVVSIAECGSLNQASRTLYIAQPSLSKSITELEKEIGTVLFHRTSKGILLTNDGIEFLAYAKQVLQQMDILEKRFDSGKIKKHFFTVSSQHFHFASEAFAKVVKTVSNDMYEMMFIEKQTQDIIHDVRTLRSEIGILYLSEMNRPVINRMIKAAHLVFEPLFTTCPYACMRKDHPLAHNKQLKLQELTPFPFLTYDQSHNNTYSMSEIILEPFHIERHLIVSDHASAINLINNTDAYCITANKHIKKSNNTECIYIPIVDQHNITIGLIRNQHMIISNLGAQYIHALTEVIEEWYLS